MIVQICGTNASGKTTAVRTLKGMATNVEPLYDEKGKKPKVVGYNLSFDGVSSKVRLLGPYEAAATGGLDAMGGKAEEIYNLIKSHHDKGYSIICEGIRAHNHTRGVEFMRYKIPYHVLLLNTTLTEILEGLKARRAARGAEMLEDTSHIQGNIIRARNYANKLNWAGAVLHKVNREDVPSKVLEILRT